MIIYIEKGYGLHLAIRDAGHNIEMLNGAWITSDDIAVQAVIDAYDPSPYEKAEAIKAIEEHATKLLDNHTSPFQIRRGQSAPSRVYFNKIFAQFTIEETAINNQLDWKLIDVEKAKINLDIIV